MTSDVSDDVGSDDVDPRRAMWRRGSYEIAGDWVAPASLSVLERVTEVAGQLPAGRRLLDVATGTGTVAIQAARLGATVVGVDLTDELVDIARRRADAADVDVRFVVGDFDRLDDLGHVGDTTFEVITSAFGVMFAPDPAGTLAGLTRRLVDGGLLGVTCWNSDGVMAAPGTVLDLLPERPPVPDWSLWTTRIGDLCADTPCEVVVSHDDELIIPFASVADCADQFERWSGGWAQLFEALDGLGVGGDARHRFREHVEAFSTETAEGIGLRARYHTSVLRLVAQR